MLKRRGKGAIPGSKLRLENHLSHDVAVDSMTRLSNVLVTLSTKHEGSVLERP